MSSRVRYDQQGRHTDVLVTLGMSGTQTGEQAWWSARNTIQHFVV